MAAGFGTIPTTERVHALSLSFHTALQTMTVGSRETTQILQRVCENNKALFNVRKTCQGAHLGELPSPEGHGFSLHCDMVQENFSWFSDRAFNLPKRAFPWFP